MILCVDMGNTDIKVGVFKDDKLLSTFRTTTDKKKSSDEYELILSSFLSDKKYKKEEFIGGILASVVPSLSFPLKEAIEGVFGIVPLVVGKGLKSGLSIRIDNPNELGADLVADAVGAIHQLGYPVLIADLGTATKLCVVDKAGSFVGCVFAPGLKLSVAALIGGTAQLPEITLEQPKRIIGKNTPDSMNSGAIYGTSAMIKALSEDIEKELGYPCKRVLTGGYGRFFKDALKDSFNYNPNLALEGLLKIYQKNEGLKNA